MILCRALREWLTQGDEGSIIIYTYDIDFTEEQ